jgi:hypothetical protein
VFLDPDIYPMNWAWWDGKMSFEHYREEHGLDSATLLLTAQDERLSQPEQEPKQATAGEDSSNHNGSPAHSEEDSQQEAAVTTRQR